MAAVGPRRSAASARSTTGFYSAPRFISWFETSGGGWRELVAIIGGGCGGGIARLPVALGAGDAPQSICPDRTAGNLGRQSHWLLHHRSGTGLVHAISGLRSEEHTSEL